MISTGPEEVVKLFEPWTVREQADAVSLAREMLRDPYWPLHAARRLGREIPWPVRYARAGNG